MVVVLAVVESAAAFLDIYIVVSYRRVSSSQIIKGYLLHKREALLPGL